MRTLIMVVGMPGIGKSYFADQLLCEYGIENVSSDEMRKHLYGHASIQGDYNEVFGAVYDTISNLFDLGEKMVVLDATNVTRHVRYKAIREIKPTEIIYVVMPDDLERALKQNEERSRKVPARVICRMYNSYKRDMPCPKYDFFHGIDCSIYHLDNDEDKNDLYSRLEKTHG